jgi:hypothetical protein
MKADFDELPPTFNRLLKNRWVGSNAKKRWMILLRDKLGADYKCPEPCEIIILWRVMHLQDDDNCKARFKVIGDALQRAGYISNDKQIKLSVNQMVVPHLKDQGFSMVIQGG